MVSVRLSGKAYNWDVVGIGYSTVPLAKVLNHQSIRIDKKQERVSAPVIAGSKHCVHLGDLSAGNHLFLAKAQGEVLGPAWLGASVPKLNKTMLFLPVTFWGHWRQQ
jgi:hypothetical protein